MGDEIESLIIGLGNPGEEYENTPHNLGFLVVDRLAASHSIRVSRKEELSFVGLGSVQGKRVALAKPQTSMNLSGRAAKGLLERYGLNPAQLIVVHDELAIPWQELRIRPDGSAAGHNGIKDVIARLGTAKFVRVRVGIRPRGEDEAGRVRGDLTGFVLGQFKRAQLQEVEEAVARGAAAVESIIAEGVEKSMAVFNRRAGGLKEEE
jgi:peptidyl-tRNA hydrolase, PTH1 family